MEWLTAIRTAIGYMEGHLGEAVGLEDVAREVHLSPFFLQRGFSLMTGYGIGEYLRNRRLYEAALDLQRGPEKVIDIAFKYGYETPESFAKAFARFHGATPTQVREGAPTRTFLPLTIQITIQGGNQMDCKITPMFPFKVIGFQKEFDYETAYAEIPRFWDEISSSATTGRRTFSPPSRTRSPSRWKGRRNTCRQNPTAPMRWSWWRRSTAASWARRASRAWAKPTR